jgi:hypothetical protein
MKHRLTEHQSPVRQMLSDRKIILILPKKVIWPKDTEDFTETLFHRKKMEKGQKLFSTNGNLTDFLKLKGHSTEKSFDWKLFSKKLVIWPKVHFTAMLFGFKICFREIGISLYINILFLQVRNMRKEFTRPTSYSVSLLKCENFHQFVQLTVRLGNFSFSDSLAGYQQKNLEWKKTPPQGTHYSARGNVNTTEKRVPEIFKSTKWKSSKKTARGIWRLEHLRQNNIPSIYLLFSAQSPDMANGSLSAREKKSWKRNGKSRMSSIFEAMRKENCWLLYRL